MSKSFFPFLNCIPLGNAQSQAGSGGDDAAAALGMDNLGGVFYVLCGGGILATVIGFFTYFYIIFKRSKQYKVGEPHFIYFLVDLENNFI